MIGWRRTLLSAAATALVALTLRAAGAENLREDPAEIFPEALSAGWEDFVSQTPAAETKVANAEPEARGAEPALLSQSQGEEKFEEDSSVVFDVGGFWQAELRIFPDDPEFPGQDNKTFSPSTALQPEFTLEFNEGDDRFTLIPFGRLDAYDDRRSHGDIREANYLHLGGFWDLLLGIDIVFWGVVESRRLVNIINQVDAVEDIRERDRLGQPMANLDLDFDEFGRLGGFLLPYFRERTFPGSDARLRGPLKIQTKDTIYESGSRENHIDFAFRYDNTVGPLDFGLAFFNGTSREPSFVPTLQPNGLAVNIPFYEIIDQTSLDAQAAVGDTVFKVEALTRGGNGDRFYAVVGGLEHTLFDIFGTGADLGLLTEYLGDGRDASAPPTPFEHDIFVGLRLTGNDVDNTNVLGGAIVDIGDGESAIFFEAERRILDDLTIALDGRFFVNSPPIEIQDVNRDGISAIRQDGFVQIRLNYYF